MITDGSQQIKAQTETLAPIAVALAQDTKDFEARHHMLHSHALARQLSILSFVLSLQRAIFAFLVRRLAVGVPAVQAAITRIRQTATGCTEPQSAFLEQSKVMHSSLTKSRRQNAPTALLNNHLRLQGVPFLLAAKESFAFFWAPLPCGCSIVHSVASMTTTCQTIPEGRNAFLPGKVNWPEVIRASSTRRTVREAVASLTPYVLAMWKSVRYSLQYIKVNKSWSHKGNLGGRPKRPNCSCKALSIVSKVSRRTPVRRRNSAGLRCWICL